MPGKYLKSLFTAFVSLFSLVASASAATSVSQNGVTWYFNNNYTVGNFVNGDWWVLDPGSGVTVNSVSPGPSGNISAGTLRNGSMINPVAEKTGFDGRIYYTKCVESIYFPYTLRPGQSLVSSISAVDGESNCQAGGIGFIGVYGDCAKGRVKSAAVLTIVSQAPAANSFRPAYAGTDKTIYSFNNVNKGILPRLPYSGKPSLSFYENVFSRVWIDNTGSATGRDTHPYQNMPNYGREIGLAVSEASLLMLMDYDVQGGQLDKLLRGFVQYGIDLYGCTRAGTQWYADGGHANGRKWAIIFTGMLLNNSAMKNIDATGIMFGEDGQTYIGTDGKGYWGADCVSPYQAAGCSGTGSKQCRPTSGVGDGCDDYRVCCTSHTWVGQALAAHIMAAENIWNHPAFFKYVDRWMAGGVVGGGNPGSTMIGNMWNLYRNVVGGGTVDNTPPLAPSNLSAPNRTTSSISLSWTAPGNASDGDGASSYRVYRNSAQVASVSTTSYTDSGLAGNTSYNYAVYSVDNANNQSSAAASGAFATLGDTAAPAIAQVSGYGTTVTVLFNENLNAASAQAAANYTINNGIAVIGAVLGSDQRTVTLTTTAQTSGTSYTLTVRNVADSSGNAISLLSANFQANDGLVTWLRCNETSGAAAADASGKGNNGTFVNSPTWVAGYQGNALRFDGFNDAVQIGTANLNPARGAIAFWANAEQFDTNPTYFFGHAVQPWSSRIQLFVDSGASSLSLGLGDTHYRQVNIQTLIPNTWYHIALSWDGSNYAVYINGAVKGSGAYTGLTAFNTFADIGNGGNTADRQESFWGKIDEFRMYNRSLSAAEISALYSQAAPLQISGVSSAGITAAGATIAWATDRAGTGQVDFGPTTAYGSSSTLLSSLTTSHSVTLSGLTAGTLYHFRVRSRDAQGIEAVSGDYTFMTTVATTNQPPVLGNIGDKTVAEGNQLSFTLSASDPDSTSLTYSAANLPTGAAFVPATRIFTWTPTANQAGAYNVTFTVSDGAKTDSETITITVIHVNQPPVLAAIGNKSTAENSTLTFSINATDADNDLLTCTAGNLPAGAQFANKTLSWKPTYNQAGTYQVSFNVSDGALQDQETIAITVSNVNRSPSLNSIGTRTGKPNLPLSFSVSGSDPDNDPLSYTAAPLPAGASFNPSTRTFAWTPTLAQKGDYQVNFAVSDGSASASETVVINVDTTNLPPTIQAVGAQAVDEGVTLTFTLTATDPENDPITYSAQVLPTGAVFNAASHVFSWTPGYKDSGNYTVNFIVTDGINPPTAVGIPIRVNNVNRKPVFRSVGDLNALQNTLMSMTVTADDPDGDPVTYSATNLPSGASFSSNTLRWTPAQAGIYPVTFYASDGQDQTSALSMVAVGHLNQAPVFGPLANKTVAAGSALNFTVSASDPESDPVILSASDLPNGASFNPITQAFSWQPASGQAGSYQVTFIASDGLAFTIKALTITVNL